MVDKEIGDVYKYKNGTLKYYQWDDQNNTDNDLTTIIIKPTIYSGTPGQTNLEGDYPTLKQLKRIKVASVGTPRLHGLHLKRANFTALAFR